MRPYHRTTLDIVVGTVLAVGAFGFLSLLAVAWGVTYDLGTWLFIATVAAIGLIGLALLGGHRVLVGSAGLLWIALDIAVDFCYFHHPIHWLEAALPALLLLARAAGLFQVSGPRDGA